MNIDNLFDAKVVEIKRDKEIKAIMQRQRRNEALERYQNVFEILITTAETNLRYMMTTSQKFRSLFDCERYVIILEYHSTTLGYLPVALAFNHKELKLEWWRGHYRQDEKKILDLFGCGFLEPFLPLLQILSQPDTTLDFFLRKKYTGANNSYCPNPANLEPATYPYD